MTATGGRRGSPAGPVLLAAVLLSGTAACSPGTAAAPTSTSAAAPATTASPPTTTTTTTAAPTTTTPPAAAGARALVVQRHPGWGLDRIGQHRLPLNDNFRAEATGLGVTVYTVDTGVTAGNPGFEGRVTMPVSFPRRHGNGTDDFGVEHGTFVAGIIAGAKTGVARKARVVVVQGISGGEGEQAPADHGLAAIVDSVDWIGAHAHRPAVVNLSLNLPSPTPGLDRAVQRLVDRGLTVVVSAGNQDRDDACRHSPAGVPSVITVAGSTEQDRPSDSTNLGRCVTLFAPGDGITSLVNADPKPYQYQDVSATSWAAPYVAGTAALYLSLHPQATPAQVKQWIIGNSTKNVLKGVPAGTPNRLLYLGGL
jgi:subtilisin family serine protease